MRSVSMGALARIASLFVVIAVCACFSSVGAAFADEAALVSKAADEQLSENGLGDCAVEASSEMSDFANDEAGELGTISEKGAEADVMKPSDDDLVNSAADMGSQARSAESSPLLDEGDYVIQSSFAGLVLDVSGASDQDGANIQNYSYNATDAQKWHVTYDEQGLYSFENIASGKLLGFSQEVAENGVNIEQGAADGSLSQKWSLVSKGAGFAIASAMNAKYVLDIARGEAVSGANVQLYQANSTAAQTFKFIAYDIAGRTYDTPLAAGDYIIQSGLGQFVLDVANGSSSNGANVQIYQYNGTGAQQWNVSFDEDGLYSFKNIQSGLMLGLSDGKAWYGANVSQQKKKDAASQKWIVTANGMQYTLTSAVDPLFVVDVANASAVNNSNVQSYYGNGSSAQSFLFLPFHPSVSTGDEIAEGVYDIGFASSGKYVVDVSGGSLADYANVQVYQSNETYAQRWGITRESNGYYTIFNLASGKVLDVSGGSPLVGSNVQQYVSNNTSAQQWSIVRNSDGVTFSFISALSGLMLDVDGEKVANGRNVCMQFASGAASQKFVLKERPLIEEQSYIVHTSCNGDLVIDVPRGSWDDGCALQVYGRNDTVAQHVVVRNDGNDCYTMQIVASGKYLTGENDSITQQAWKTDGSQSWAVSLGRAGIVFKNSLTGKTLAVASSSAANGTKLVLRPESTTSWFSLEPCKLVNKGVYTIASALSASKRVVDVAGGSLSRGTNVQLYQANGSYAQKFLIAPVDDTYYKVTLALSAKVLDVANGSTSSGANVRLYDWNGTDAQLWSLEMGEDGLLFVNKGSGLLLEVSKGTDANGANIDQAATTQRYSQCWLLSPASVNLGDRAFLTALVRSIPGSSSVVSSMNNSAENWSRLMNALQDCWDAGYSVGFILTDLQSGDYIALNADRTFYGASTMKGAYVTWIFEELLETGRVSWSQVSDLVTSTVTMSNNDTYHRLRDMFGDAEFNQWLQGVGLSGWGSARFAFYTPRELQLMWVRMLSYEQSGGNFVDSWRRIFNHSYYSQIYYELAPGKTTYTKPGWYPRTGDYGALADSGIVVGSDGQRYLLTVLSDINCYGGQWIERNIVGALNAMFDAQPHV